MFEREWKNTKECHNSFLIIIIRKNTYFCLEWKWKWPGVSIHVKILWLTIFFFCSFARLEKFFFVLTKGSELGCEYLWILCRYLHLDLVLSANYQPSADSMLKFSTFFQQINTFFCSFLIPSFLKSKSFKFKFSHSVFLCEILLFFANIYFLLDFFLIQSEKIKLNKRLLLFISKAIFKMILFYIFLVFLLSNTSFQLNEFYQTANREFSNENIWKVVQITQFLNKHFRVLRVDLNGRERKSICLTVLRLCIIEWNFLWIKDLRQKTI